MEILENLYEFEVKKIDFVERKVDIPQKNIHLFGPPWSGKTFIIFNYLSYMNPKHYLYVDLADMRLGDRNFANLNSFLDLNPVRCVVFDNWNGDESYLPLERVQTICISRLPYSAQALTPLYVPPLDFEEYILFENVPSHQITHTFNNFIKFGTIPFLVRANHDLKNSLIQGIIRAVFPNETQLALFTFLLRSTGLAFTQHQIFQKLKGSMKISKDKFYIYMEEMTSMRMIFLLPKYAQPNAAKKVYAYDFALRDGVTFEKNFANVYENMILTELIKLSRSIYYIGLIDFYIPDVKLGVIAMPFSSRGAITTLLDKLPKEIAIERIEIITMGFEDMFVYNGIEVEVLPYWTWALKDEK